MPAPYGRFVWYELMTTDVTAAKAFYGQVVGWAAQETDIAGPIYTLLTVADTPVAGMMDLPDDARAMGVPPCWIGYVGVEDVDATADHAQRIGGSVHVQPRDIPNVGRFAMISDPQGASLAIFRWLDSEMGQPAPGGSGHFGWHELMATNWAGVFPFYAELFGWEKGDAVPMGPMGVYQLFKTGGQQAVGGMVDKPAMIPVPFWLYYVYVGDIDAATVRVTEAGGQVINGPMEVPGGTWIVQCKDPQGATFAMVRPPD